MRLDSLKWYSQVLHCFLSRNCSWKITFLRNLISNICYWQTKCWNAKGNKNTQKRITIHQIALPLCIAHLRENLTYVIRATWMVEKDLKSLFSVQRQQERRKSSIKNVKLGYDKKKKLSYGDKSKHLLSKTIKIYSLAFKNHGQYSKEN